MDRNFCVGCSTVSNQKMPPCVVANIISNIPIEDLINTSEINTKEVFVCPKGAVDIASSRLVINNRCADCMLCALCCPLADTSSLSLDVLPEHVLFSTTTTMHILLQSLIPDATVANDVHVIGNSRKKRIDLVIKKKNQIFLIKLLKNTNKMQFYTRSYQEVVDTYQPQFPDHSFHIIALTEKHEHIPEGLTNNSVYCLKDFVKYAKEI